MPEFDLFQRIATLKLTCPTCKVAFSNQLICRRCGSDLSLLMKAAIRAWEFREQVRQYIQAGRFAEAFKFALSAQAIHRTLWGEWIKQFSQCGRDIQSHNNEKRFV